ncbi:hypothetical protein, partial [Marinobacter salarius]
KWLVWRIGNPIGNIGLNPSPIEFKTPKCNEPRKTGVRQQSEPAVFNSWLFCCAPGMARSALTGAVPVQVVLAG